MGLRVFLNILFLISFLVTCSQNEESVRSSSQQAPNENQIEAPVFTKLSPSQTGISFANHVTDSVKFNALNYAFMYNGGGVAIGDINNDGLSDIFLTGNMVTSRLLSE
ncbi:MAG: hypothetical protein U5K69_06760 [Balneolaceae bacterium]|nr:hypothetical protein [Balneolaceae bacterium]